MPRPRVATGLFTNWDSILFVDERIVDLLSKASKREPASEVLTTIEEACYTLDCALKQGGREYLISREVYGELNKMFPRRVWKLGGNGYHMGRALYYRGFNPLVSYPCRPPRMMQASPNFRVAHKGETHLPSEVAREGDHEYDHVVFEYNENPALGIRGSGRHILSWDEMSSKGLLDMDFLDMATSIAHIDILVLGYAHLLLPARKHVTDLIAERLDHARRPRVHLEVGEGSRESVVYAIEVLTKLQCIDSLGLNERECVQYLHARSEEFAEQKTAAVKALDELNLKRICVHTPKWVFSVVRGTGQREADALTAAVQAAAEVTHGSMDHIPPPGQPKIWVERLRDVTVTRVEAIRNPNPRVLTGLGDAFAAVQAAEALA